MEIAIKFISVASIAILELWAAIPAGIALSLHPLLIGLASIIGATIGAALVIFLGDALQKWLLRKENETKKNNTRIYVIWEKYGVIGLGLLAPLITGVLLGAVVGVSLKAAPRRLMLWMSIGIVIWSVLLTAIATLGLKGLQQLI